jgi:REP element-mobilizing transposase RayT
MTDPVALFITWTTYATWLPGDERGHVSNQLTRQDGFHPKENRPGAPYAKGNAFTHERAQSLQKWPTVWLTPPQAMIVANSLVEVALKQGWVILRAAIMANHVHVVVIDYPIDGPAVRRILKGKVQTQLSAAIGTNRRWWTAGGSDRRRSGDQSIRETIRYVAEQPGKLAEVIENVVVTPRADRRG